MSNPQSDVSDQETAYQSSAPASAPELPGGRSFQPGQVIAGRYRMIQRIGQGGMGDVFLVQDMTLDQEVALKFLPEQLATDPTRLALFHREVRTARQVTHANVCRMFDIGEVDGHPFLSMQYVKGEDLASLLRRAGRLPEERGLQIARQLCAGLQAAHDQGVLHRDLKPANILVDEDGHVFISDFGLAGAATEIKDVSSGTPAYMAPEQLAGKEVTTKSDLFSLGLILYEIFTGKRPYEGKSVPDLLKARSDTHIPTPTSAVRDLSAQTEAAILRCLEPEPDERPASAVAISALLPGGDPLAEALAAGKTPSPELVAAAGRIEAVPLKLALAGLVTALMGIGITYVLRSNINLINRVPFEKPPAVLADHADSILTDLGYGGLPYAIDGLRLERAYLDFQEAEAPPETRWDALTTGEPPALVFWYRKSPQPLIPMNVTRARPSLSDPPLEFPGMTRLELDWEGRLLELVAVPDEKAASESAGEPWSELFRAAHLDPEAFVDATPEWTPPVFAHEHRAWSARDGTRRIEAASLGGRAVWFRTIRPWDAPRESTVGETSFSQRVIMGTASLFIFLLLAGGLYLAYRNLALGRGDRVRARRLAMLAFSLNMSGWLLLSQHFADPSAELNHLINGCVSALFLGALLWIFYIALEPYVRRIWPRGLIGWTRLFSGEVRDPLVGRDFLVGAAAGGFLAVMTPLRDLGLSYLENGTPYPDANALLGVFGLRYTLVVLVNQLMGSINNAFLLILAFVLSWMVVRRAWLALGLVGIILAVAVASQTTFTLPGLVYLVLILAVSAYVLWNFGLLAMITALFFEMVLRTSTLTLDVSAWFATPTLTVLGILISVVIYAFVTARAGEPLFGRALVPD